MHWSGGSFCKVIDHRFDHFGVRNTAIWAVTTSSAKTSPGRRALARQVSQRNPTVPEPSATLATRPQNPNPPPRAAHGVHGQQRRTPDAGQLPAARPCDDATGAAGRRGESQVGPRTAPPRLARVAPTLGGMRATWVHGSCIGARESGVEWQKSSKNHQKLTMWYGAICSKT